MKSQASFKNEMLLSVSLSSLFLFSCAVNSETASRGSVTKDSSVVVATTATITPPPVTEKAKKKIKIALLLDTSNSMDGLIDQARAQLWKLVNELSFAKCDNEKPELEIALYEYGNDGLSSTDGFIRQVSMFTNDLDLISEKLFSLKTNGGSEFCGQVISSASQQLEWKKDTTNLQLIFIAGNESFHQGMVNSTESCSYAKEKDIIVNTIFCGNYSEGINLGWKNGAILTHGNYMSIEQDKKTIYIETPFDNEIAQLNDQLNDTYVNYGSLGYEKKANQIKQDKNAEVYGKSNTTNRVLSKASKFYSNSSWDLVDASKRKEFDVTKVKESELPKELVGKTKQQKQDFIALKSKERETVIMQIGLLNVKRNTYIAEKSKTLSGDDLSLDAAMIKAIREQATKKNFVFEM